MTPIISRCRQHCQGVKGLVCRSLRLAYPSVDQFIVKRYPRAMEGVMHVIMMKTLQHGVLPADGLLSLVKIYVIWMPVVVWFFSFDHLERLAREQSRGYRCISSTRTLARRSAVSITSFSVFSFTVHSSLLTNPRGGHYLSSCVL